MQIEQLRIKDWMDIAAARCCPVWLDNFEAKE